MGSSQPLQSQPPPAGGAVLNGAEALFFAQKWSLFNFWSSLSHPTFNMLSKTKAIYLRLQPYHLIYMQIVSYLPPAQCAQGAVDSLCMAVQSAGMLHGGTLPPESTGTQKRGKEPAMNEINNLS